MRPDPGFKSPPSLRAPAKPRHLFVLYPGEKRYELADRVTVLPAAEAVGLSRALSSLTGRRRT